MKKVMVVILGTLLVFGGAVIYKLTDGSTDIPFIATFEQCADAGYPVQQSYPRKCSVPDVGTFTEL